MRDNKSEATCHGWDVVLVDEAADGRGRDLQVQRLHPLRFSNLAGYE